MNILTNNLPDVLAPVSSFYETAANDAQLSATHISLYFALYHQWTINKYISPFQIKREIIMQAAKISSRQTFNKCMRLLHIAGYIKYIPSYNPDVCSMVCINS